MSQASAIASPAPAAAPGSAATVGLRTASSAPVRLVWRQRRSARRSSKLIAPRGPRPPIALTSPPEQKAVPAPVISSAPTLSSSDRSLIWVRSAAVRSGDIALRASGRLRVMTATRSRTMHKSSFVPVSMFMEPPAMTFPVTEHTVKTDRHTTGYLACGPQDGPLLVFCHGWPELSLSWRHQLPAFAALGFRCVAPDMRGYGRSSTYTRHEDFAQELIVHAMLELLASLGRDKAVWIGHDWGSPVVWNMAAHHPDRTVGVASLCVPYLSSGFTLDTVVPLVDRSVYPEAEYQAGQWDYQFFYEESFDKAHASFEANIRNVVKALFRKGNPEGIGKPSRTAAVRKAGGWLGGGAWPDLPRDADVLTEPDLEAYVAALTRNGFFGPDSWYMNHKL